MENKFLVNAALTASLMLNGCQTSTDSYGEVVKVESRTITTESVVLETNEGNRTFECPNGKFKVGDTPSGEQIYGETRKTNFRNFKECGTPGKKTL
jgi:hypothetical protein